MYSNLQAEFRNHLLSDENLLWTGRAGTGIHFEAKDIYQTFFGIFWLGFAIYWTSMAAQGSTTFSLFGIPFILIGINLVFGRFIYNAFQRKHTLYALTDNRILIRSGYLNRQFKSLNLHSLKDIHLTEHNDGTGTITFGTDTSTANNQNHWNSNHSNASTAPLLSFARIDSANQVYQKIIRLQNDKIELALH